MDEMRSFSEIKKLYKNKGLCNFCDSDSDYCNNCFMELPREDWFHGCLVKDAYEKSKEYLLNSMLSLIEDKK